MRRCVAGITLGEWWVWEIDTAARRAAPADPPTRTYAKPGGLLSYEAGREKDGKLRLRWGWRLRIDGDSDTDCITGRNCSSCLSAY